MIALPSGLILRQKARTGVYIQQKGKALWRFVEVGLRGGDRVEILDGLAVEELVITPLDSKRFYEGRKVKVTLP